MRITYWLKLNVLVFIVIFSSCFIYAGTGYYSVIMEEKGYLWEGEIVNPFYFISPSPQSCHFAEVIVAGLQEAKKGYIISFTVGEDIITVQDSRKLFTAFITITHDGYNFFVELLVKPKLSVIGVTKFGTELSNIIKQSVEGM